MIVEIVFVIAVFFWILRLSSRIDKIEETLSINNEAARAESAISENVQPKTQTPSIQPRYSPSKSSNLRSSVIDWLSHEWPLKLGALFVLIGIGWFVSYAFAQNWIGAQGRVISGFVVGSIILIWGYFHTKINLHQSAVIVALGGAIIMLALYAATTVYAFFSPEIAFGLFGIVLLYMSFLAYMKKYEPMAIAALVMAGFIPFVVGGRSISLATFFIYMLSVVGGSLWLVAITRWRVLPLIANIMVFVHSIPYLWDYTFTDSLEGATEPLTFAFTFAGIFFTARLVSQYASKKTSHEDIAGSMINTLFALSWIYAAVPAHLKSTFASLAGGITLTAAWIIYFTTRQKSALVLYASITWIFVFIAAIFELEKSTVSIVSSVMILTYSIILNKILEKPVTAAKTGGLFIVPVVLTFINYFFGISDAPYIILTLATVSASMYSFVAYFYTKLHNTPEYADVRSYIIAAGYTATIYLYLFIGEFADRYFDNPARQIIPVILIACIGTVIHVYGNIKSHKTIRVLGFLSMLYVSARILFIESHTMSIGAKTITFIGIGVIFMSTMLTNKLKKT